MAKKQKPKFLKRGDEYIYLTGESPKNFDGVLFVAWSGIPAVESVEPLDKLKGAKEITDIPDDVYNALVEAGVVAEREPEPKPEPKPEPQRRRRVSQQEEECYLHVAAGTDFPTACAASGFLFDEPDDKPKETKEPFWQQGETVWTSDGQFMINLLFVLVLVSPIVLTIWSMMK